MSIEQGCEGCGHRFEVPDSLAGGVTNCPQCKHLQTIDKGDGFDAALFWGPVGLITAGGLAAGGIIMAVGNPIAGAVFIAVILLIVGLVVLAS